MVESGNLAEMLFTLIGNSVDVDVVVVVDLVLVLWVGRQNL